MVPGPVSELAESPVWLEQGQRLAFVDMVTGTLHVRDLESGADEAAHLSVYLGAVVETRSGGLACVTLDSVGIVSGAVLSTAARILDDDAARLNDAACDPWGRLWVGSTSRTGVPGAGALHLWTPGEKPLVLLGGLTQPNGIGWSPDRASVYVVDTARSLVLTAALDADTGDIGAFETLMVLEGSSPDGLAVGADGSIWMAMWGGSRVDRYRPDGSLVESVRMPVQQPTSCAFAGEGTLVVTTARFGLDGSATAAHSAAGHILSLGVGIGGAPVGRLAA